MVVYAIVDVRSSSDDRDAVKRFARREDAERFLERVRGDEPELGNRLGIEERELEEGGRD